MKFEIGDIVKSGRQFWEVRGFVGKKYMLERKINWKGEHPYTERITKTRSSWRIKKVNLTAPSPKQKEVK